MNLLERGSLADRNPALLEEWDWDKNEVNPNEIVAGYTKKVWWKCKNGHEWKALIFKRTKGEGCPYCNNK